MTDEPTTPEPITSPSDSSPAPQDFAPQDTAPAAAPSPDQPMFPMPAMEHVTAGRDFGDHKGLRPRRRP